MPHRAGTVPREPALQSGIQHLAAGTMDHPGLNASRFMTIVSILRGLAGPASALKTIETGTERASKPISTPVGCEQMCREIIILIPRWQLSTNIQQQRWR